MRELVKSNEALARAVEMSEKRVHNLEKKAKKNKKYEEIIKNCQRLQCIGCNKLYTPALFTTHSNTCCKQQMRTSQTINEDMNEMDEVVQEELFLAKIVDMKQIYIDMTSDEDIMSSNSDDMVTIMRENNQI